VKKLINKYIRRVSDTVAADILRSQTLEKMLLAQGATAARQIRAVETVATLAEVELRIFSQWGEDGIIEWLIHHNGPMPQSFVEFGVEDYTEANTRFLLASRNWRGLILDGSPSHIDKIKASELCWRHDLTAVSAFITRENINGLIAGAGFSGEVGLLSVDIDGNDYWVWEAIEGISPHIVIAEYNAVFGDLSPLTIPYDPAFQRTKGHFSNLYWGAGIAAFTRLAQAKGYTLLGTNRAGCNAFFVRNDRLPRFAGRIQDLRPMPSHLRDSRDAHGQLSLVGGEQRRHVIDELTVWNLDTLQSIQLRRIEQLYSPRWKALMRGECPPEPV
jgi:hypothetical protein